MTEGVVRVDRGDGRDQNGRLMPGHTPPGAHVITSKDARELALKGHRMAREKAAEGLLASLQEKAADGSIPMPHVPVEAYKYLVKHAADVFMDSNSVRGLSELGTFLAKVTGMVVDPAEMKNDGVQTGNSLEDANVILQVFQFFDQNFDQKDVIDVEAK